MRLPCYDSPTAQTGWCRAVTPWQPLVYVTFFPTSFSLHALIVLSVTQDFTTKQRNLKNSAVISEYFRIKILLRHSINFLNVQVIKLDVGSTLKAKNSAFFCKNSSHFKKLLYFCHQNNIIMSQSAYTIRLDSDLKRRFDALCEGFGMSASTAFNIFVRAVVRKRRIPFEIEMSEIDESFEKGRQAFLEIRRQAEEGRFPDLTLEEINEEIRLAREGK